MLCDMTAWLADDARNLESLGVMHAGMYVTGRSGVAAGVWPDLSC